MSEDNTEWVISNGIVKKQKTLVMEAVPLTEFFENMSKMAPKDMETPVLPPNTVKYVRRSDSNASSHTFVLYYPAAIRTIFYHSNRGSGTRGTPYNIAFPHLVFKIDFGATLNVHGIHVAVCEMRPTKNQDKLFKFRIPNLSNDRICMTPVSSPGDMAESCVNSVDGFFVGQTFNNDWQQYPRGINDFEDWANKTSANERCLETVNWDYLCTLGEWVSERRNNVAF